MVVEACRLDGYDNGDEREPPGGEVVEACRLDGYDNGDEREPPGGEVVEACRLDGYDNGIYYTMCCDMVVEACRLDGYDNSGHMQTQQGDTPGHGCAALRCDEISLSSPEIKMWVNDINFKRE